MTFAAIAAHHRLSKSRVQRIVAQAAEEEAEKNRAEGCTDAFEWGVKPRRIDVATRVSLVVLHSCSTGAPKTS